MSRAPHIVTVSLALVGVSACTPQGAAQGDFAPEYLGVQTSKLDNELVKFDVKMQGARSNDDVTAYSRCAAAQYALIRGFGFARHLRTNVTQEGGVWQADAVYTISAALPRGLQTIDAEVVVADCSENSIPTV